MKGFIILKYGWRTIFFEKYNIEVASPTKNRADVNSGSKAKGNNEGCERKFVRNARGVKGTLKCARCRRLKRGVHLNSWSKLILVPVSESRI